MSSTVRTGAIFILIIAAFVAAIAGFKHRGRVEAALHHLVPGRSGAPIAVGKQFPALDLASPAGDRVRFTPAPGKVTIVNVFATWCPPCRAESPAYASFSTSAAARGVDIVAIDRAETAQKVDAFRREFGLTFPYLIDDGSSTKDILGARAMPVTIVVDGQGIVRADIAGPMTTERLKALVADVTRPL
ncbi:MAG TPA: TlpA disulfide reductase family protein [Candidatus Eremiobacteraceae bacterium]|nr:TlpA disulfide reductase family protein [Candidatus Eremiobacteraceae bacterium]